MKRIVIMGDSHSRALMAAKEAFPERFAMFDIYWVTEREGAGGIDGPRSVEIVKGLDADTPVVASRIGTMHNHLALFAPEREYAFLDKDGFEASEENVTREMLVAHFRETMDITTSMEKWSRRAKGGLTVLSIPPPKQSQNFLFDKYALRRSSPQRKGDMSPIRFARPDYRLRLWEAEQEAARQWAKERGAGFIPAPAKCFNLDGFLARRFYANDITHANKEYGALVLKQLATHFTRKKSDKA